MNIERLDRLKYIIDSGKYIINKETGEVFSVYLDRNMSACPDGAGYLGLNLSVKGKPYAYKIHELVAFVNGMDLLDKTVNHIDGNSLNNHPSNLETMSREDNIRHRHTLSKVGMTGSPMTPIRRKAVKICFDNGMNIEEIAVAFGMHTQAIELALIERTGGRALTQEEATEIRGIYATGKFTLKELAEKYLVSKNTINDIVKLNSYKDIKDVV